jgi:hypothetical protein
VTLKRIRRARISRLVAGALCVLVLGPQLLTGSMRPAVAQQAHLSVIVIDFTNRSAIGSPLLGRRAASAMSLQLRQSDNWDPVSQSQVDQKMAELRLRPPYDRVQLQSLARSLDANAVLTGDVLSARVTSNPAQATVKIVARLRDVASGELINGAVASGIASHIGLDAAEDVLLDEALSRAAFDARQKMERTQIPEGTVLNTTVVSETRQDALLNIGARHGVRQGMQFVVLRGHELVGYVSASSVDADKTVAAITQNFRGIKPEDNVRAIFTLPEGADVSDTGVITPGQPKPGDVVQPTPGDKPKTSHKSLTGAVRIMAGLLIAAGIYALATRPNSGSTNPFSTAARATSIGGTDPNAAAAVRVTWNRPRQIPPNAVVQYQVYRVDPTSGIPILVGISNEANREIIDTATARQVNNYFNYTGTSDPGTIVTTPLDVPALTPGRQYRYYVQTIYNEGVTLDTGDTTTGGTTTTTGGTTTGAVLKISQPSKTTGFVTPVAMPAVTAPADRSTVDLASVTVAFTTVAGADFYSIQMSADPTNPNSFQEVGRFLNPSRVGGQTATVTVNVANRFAGRTLLLLRVGAKNSSDAAPPINGFVFSNIISLVPQ